MDRPTYRVSAKASGKMLTERKLTDRMIEVLLNAGRPCYEISEMTWTEASDTIAQIIRTYKAHHRRVPRCLGYIDDEMEDLCGDIYIGFGHDFWK